MTKHTQKTQVKITTWYGYGLFMLMVVGVLVNTVIPTISVSLNPGVSQLNSFVFLISMVAGILLPVLLAYLVGNKATRVQTKEIRRYNGVLFGLVAYWLAMLFAMFGSTIISATHQWLSASLMTILVNIWPIVATVVTVLIIGWLYSKKKSKESALLYTPYTVTLGIAASVAGIVLPLASLLYPDNFHVNPVFAAFVFIGVVVVSYIALVGKRLSLKERTSHVIVATSIGFIALNVVSQLVPYEWVDISLTSPSSIVFALISAGIWASYLVLLRRSVK